MVVIDYFFLLSGIALLAVMAYLWFLAVVSLMPEKKSTISSEPRTKFAILIPAHNEVSVIGAALESIKKLDYPTVLFETIVIADNCQDDTAGAATRAGARVLERRSEEKRGKGYALKWVFNKLKENNTLDVFDAFIIIDADTVVDPQFLRAMDTRVARGEKAVQGYYAVMDEQNSPMASLSCLGFALSRHLKYKGRTRLGWSSNLLGNGMCFSKEVIKRFGWGATSIVEDIEYAVILLLNGITVSFAPEAMVFAEIPETFKGSRVQRSRWDIGRFQVRNKYLGSLVMEGVRTRNLACWDTAMELLIPPFSLFVVLCLFLFGLFSLFSSERFEFLSSMWYINMFLLFSYITTGLIKAKARFKTYLYLVYAPFFLVWRVQTMAWGYFAKIGKVWIKTARKDLQ